MNAIVYTIYGSPDVLHLEEVKKPALNKEKVLVKVHATSINAGDWLMTGSAAARPLADPLGTGFTYQGRLTDAGAPANGTYDFQFSLFNAQSSGTQVGTTLTVTGVTVTNGLFTVLLDFGNVYDGTARYLQIAVRTGGGGSYTPLNPLQPLSASPYALYTKQADNADRLDTYHASNTRGNIPISNGSLNVNLNADKLDGQDASAFMPAAGNLIIVAKTGGNFSTITTALNSISGASDTNRYLIYVAPGVYNEQVTMKQYVDIQGSGELTTKITFAGSATDTLGTVIGANDAELRFLTVESTGGDVYAISIYNNNASPRLTHITVSAKNSSDVYGVYNDYSSPIMTDVTASADGYEHTYGIYNLYSSPTMTNVSASAKDGDLATYGMNNISSSVTINNSIINAEWGG